MANFEQRIEPNFDGDSHNTLSNDEDLFLLLYGDTPFDRSYPRHVTLNTSTAPLSDVLQTVPINAVVLRSHVVNGKVLSQTLTPQFREFCKRFDRGTYIPIQDLQSKVYDPFMHDYSDFFAFDNAELQFFLESREISANGTKGLLLGYELFEGQAKDKAVQKYIKDNKSTLKKAPPSQIKTSPIDDVKAYIKSKRNDMEGIRSVCDPHLTYFYQDVVDSAEKFIERNNISDELRIQKFKEVLRTAYNILLKPKKIGKRKSNEGTDEGGGSGGKRSKQTDDKNHRPNNFPDGNGDGRNEDGKPDLNFSFNSGPSPGSTPACELADLTKVFSKAGKSAGRDSNLSSVERVILDKDYVETCNGGDDSDNEDQSCVTSINSYGENVQDKEIMRTRSNSIGEIYNPVAVELFLTSVETGNDSATQQYLVLGVDVENATRYGFSAFHIAAMHGHLDVVKRLWEHLRKKPNISTQVETAVRIATCKGHLHVVQYLLSHCLGNKKAANYDGREMLHFAATAGHLCIVRFLIENCNAGVNSVDQNSSTPLHFACSAGHFHIVEYLLMHGAKPDFKNQFGFSAIDMTHSNEHLNIYIKLLTKYGRVKSMNGDVKTITKQVATNHMEKWSHSLDILNVQSYPDSVEEENTSSKSDDTTNFMQMECHIERLSASAQLKQNCFSAKAGSSPFPLVSIYRPYVGGYAAAAFEARRSDHFST